MATVRQFVDCVHRYQRAITSHVLVLWLGTICGRAIFASRARIYSRILIHGPGTVVVGGGSRFTGRRQVNELLTTTANAKISIGRNCHINGAIIGAAELITIGDDCIIAEAYIRDTSSHGMEADRRHDKAAAKIAPVVLENNVWLGSQVHVMPGVTIGENSVIGVNSVVTKSIPRDVFAAGNPARVIKPLPGLDD